MKKIFLTLLFCIIALPGFAKDDLELIKVKNDIHIIKSSDAGNITISTGNDGVFIIDDQLSGQSRQVEKLIAQITNQPIDFIVNTHFHFDHTGGNEFFGKKDSTIISHENVRTRLSSDQLIELFDKKMKALSKRGLPVITFSENMTFYYNNDEIELTHVPNAHTDGDAIVFFKNRNIMVTGDIVFSGMYPFIDIGNGGSVAGLLRAIDTIIKKSDSNTIIIPGHGPILNLNELKEYQNVIARIAINIKNQITQGKSLKDVVRKRPTAKYDKKYGDGFINPETFVKIIYSSFKPEEKSEEELEETTKH
jgi:glyoxylase-like metal-dependent hydrolase (beta-lactamase superfamily II)